jgi:hypothetical protein
MLKPLILLTEAPKPKGEDDLPADDPKQKPAPKGKGKDSLPEDDAPPSDDPTDGSDDDGTDNLAAGGADDGTGGDDVNDLEDDDNIGDPSLDMSQGKQPDPVAEKIKRERLYDAIVDSQQQCEQLSASADVIIDRIQDDTARKFAIRAKQMVDDTAEQCAIIRTRFADLGYERTRDLYATMRERVSAVAEIIKHVIDGDDDFRKTDSGAPQRNGSTAE